MSNNPTSEPRRAFPTLADTLAVAGGTLPAGMRVIPARPHLGHPTLYLCTCHRTVPADELMDFRELPAAALAALGLPTRCCRACFQQAEVTGRVLHAAIARVMGLHADTVASLESASRFALAKGWHATTPTNAHLAPLGG